VITQDDTPRPPVRLSVGNRGREDRTIFRLAMKLWARLKRQRRPQCEMRGVAEPGRTVLESGAFTPPLQIVAAREPAVRDPAEPQWSVS
jgi:hypothetical protein